MNLRESESLTSDVHGASVLELRVCAQHMLGRQDDYIGGVKETINSLLAGGETKGHSFPFNGCMRT
jgi:hypothetical protein